MTSIDFDLAFFVDLQLFADTAISALPPNTTPASTDVTVVVSGGADNKVTLANFVKAGGAVLLSAGAQTGSINITSTVTCGQVSIGSTSIVGTEAIIGGNIIASAANSLPAFSDNGTVATTIGTAAKIGVGTIAANTAALAFGCGASGTNPTVIGADAGSVAGITANLLSVKVGSTIFIGINGSGDLGVFRHITNVGGIWANGNSTGVQPGSGEFFSNTSTTTGKYHAGGTTTAASWEFGINFAGAWSAVLDAGGFAPVHGGLYTNSSDRRWKKNIKPIKAGLAEILALKPSTFTWKADGKDDLGFIAQDLRSVLPELVHVDVDGFLHLNYNGVTPVLVKAVQQLATRIAAIEKKAA